MDSRQAERNALADKIAALLKHYRLAHTEDDEGYGYPLVDALTDDELENLAQQVIDTSVPAPDDGDGYSFHHDEFIAFARAVEAETRSRAVAKERHDCEIAVWLVRMEATKQDAPDEGVSGWLQAAEDAIRMRSNG